MSYAVPIVALDPRAVHRSDDLGFPFSPVAVGDYLVVLNVYSPPHIHVLHTETGALVGAFGGSGRGPGEYLAPISASLEPGSRDLVWVNDPNQGRLTLVSLARMLAGADPVVLMKIIEYPGLRQVLRTPDDRFLASSASGAYRFALIDGDGRIEARLGDSVDHAEDVPASIAGQAEEALIALHPERDLIAAAGIRTGRLLIHDYNGRPVDTAETPFDLTPRFRVGRRSGQPSLVPGADMRYGYLSLAVTATRIFALYSGQTRGEGNSRDIGGTDIHVFDWDGTLLGVYQLAVSMVGIAVSDDGETVFAVRLSDDPSVWTARLPPLPTNHLTAATHPYDRP
ncbi:MAG: BF3164 family lipoprotein [Gemmatimonadales bacterium]